MKTHSSLAKFTGIQKLCIVVHRKELIKIYPPLLSNSLLTRRKTKSLKKSEAYIEDVGTLTKINVEKKSKHYLAGCLKTYRTKIAVF